jgi:uncharacterized repeat protein (TIGR02543 family)
MNSAHTLQAVFTQITYTLTISVTGSGSTNPAVGSYVYSQGSSVQVTASPVAGWSFDHWVLDGSSAGSVNPYTVTMNSGHTLGAVFTQSTYTLTVSTSGQGSVSKVPSQATYAYGSSVQLTATPSTGWSFSGWSGGASGTANPLTIVMNDNKAVTATFTQNQYTLTVNTSGQGSVAKAPNQATYASGSSVQLTATPAAGYVFSGWSGDLSGSANPATVTMNANKAVTATFTQSTYTLTVTVSPTAGGTVTRNNNGPYHLNDVVVLTEAPSAGYTFSSWSGDGTGSGTTRTVTITGNMAATATFTQNQYQVVFATSGSGATSPSGTQTYAAGAVVPISATAGSDYTFSSWSATGSIVIASVSSVSTTATINGAGTITAAFTQIQYTLTIQSPDGSGSTSPAAGSYTYNQGASAQVTATPSSGWIFDRWLIDEYLTSQENPINVRMDSAHKIKAIFILLQYTLVLSANGLGTTSPSIGTRTYSSGIQVMVSATPDSGWQFTGWSGDLSGSSNPASITMNGDKTVTAIFTQNQYTVTASSSIFVAKDPSNNQLYSGSSATTAIQTAINAASPGDTIHLNPATYTLVSTINGKSEVSLTGEPGVIISMSGLGSGARAISYSGSTGASTTTTSQASKGATSITVSSTSGISGGTLLYISTTQVWKGNTRHIQQGEIRIVDNVIGNIIYLTQALDDTYASSATVRVVNPVKNINVSNISFTGVQGRNQEGIWFTYGQNLKIHDLSFSYVEAYDIFLGNVIDSEVYNNSFDHANMAGLGYGISLAYATQNINVHDNRGDTCRHTIAIGGSPYTPGIPRHIYVHNNYSTHATSSGFDCHPCAEDIQYVNNTSVEDTTGMSMNMFSGLVKDNIIQNPLECGVRVNNLVGDDYLVVSYNNISGSKNDGIESKSKNVQILYNILNNCNSGIPTSRGWASISILRGSGQDNDEIVYNYSADYCNIYGNTITNSGGANPCPAIYIASGVVGTTYNKP